MRGREGRHITQGMIDHLDARAGKRHSVEGSVMTTLRELIEMYEASGRAVTAREPSTETADLIAKYYAEPDPDR